MEIHEKCMVQFLPLGGHIPEDDPDRNRYRSLDFREPGAKFPDETELTLLSPGDVFLLYTDGVCDGSDRPERRKLEEVMHEQYRRSAKEIGNASPGYALERDERLRQAGEQDCIDDKTVFIVKCN